MANFSTIWFHHVFTTRNRERVIAEELDQALHDHLGSVMKSDGAVLLAAGGASDHLHTLVGCRPTVPACDIARRLKSKSSLWLKKRCRAWPGWQPGRLQVLKQKTFFCSKEKPFSTLAGPAGSPASYKY